MSAQASRIGRGTRILPWCGHSWKRRPISDCHGRPKGASMGQDLPLVGVTACRRMIGAHPFHIAGDKYLRAVADGANAMPLVIPAFGAQIKIELLLDRLDGVLVTGSVSNVEPARYGGPPGVAGTAHDPARDATTLP